VGDRFGLIVYHQSQMPFLRGIVRRYGMEHHVVDFGVTGFDLPDLAAHHDEVVENFVNEAKRLIRQGSRRALRRRDGHQEEGEIEPSFPFQDDTKFF
jgi:hypothetical protein